MLLAWIFEYKHIMHIKRGAFGEAKDRIEFRKICDVSYLLKTQSLVLRHSFAHTCQSYFEFQEEVVEILRQRDVTCKKMEDMKKTSDDELAVQILRLSGELSTDSISMEIKGIERSRKWGETGGLQVSH